MSTNETTKADLLVIGAGPGGYAAAFLASDLGLSVTMVDPEENPGGVCLHYGCIPTKTLLRAVKMKSEMESAKQMGLRFDNLTLDIDALRKFKDSVVKKLTGGLGQLTKRRKISYIRGKARFTGKDSAEIEPAEGDTEQISFDKAVIATGTRAASIPGVELDGKKVLYARPALDIEEVPESLLVVGGGYIGLELGTIYARLGSKVTIVEMLPNIMPGADRDLVKLFLKENSDTFEDIRTGTKVSSVEVKNGGLEVRFQPSETDKESGGANSGDGAGGSETFDKVLMTAGRQPNSGELNLEAAGIEPGKKGFIPVDKERRTENENIFAVGDITGPPLLAHKAHMEGRVAASVAAGRKDAYEPAAIPSVEYTDPEIAWTGMTEEEAKEKNIAYKTAVFPWGASGRAATLGISSGKTKIIADTETDRIIGAGIVGNHADELIPEATLAIEMAALVSDIGRTIHPHPTLSETLMEAADAYYGTATDIYSPKR
jgi:dihydrolipoamide dehydrogenase